MKRSLFAGALLGAAVFVCGPIAHAAEQKVTGTLLDPKCNMSKPADPCHLDGAKRGDPLIIHAAAGRDYKLQGPFVDRKNEKLLDLVGKRVTATGKASLAGAARILRVTKIELVKDAKK